MEQRGTYCKNTDCVRCDLHVHSVFSDGSCTPEELVAEAGRLGLIIALTDHNTADGLPELTEAAQAHGVTVVPGVEFSTGYQGKELHLLGLFVLPQHYAAVKQLVKEQQALKEINNIELVERLNRAGYRIDYESVKQRNPHSNVNRAHLAAALYEQGYVSSVYEAFDTLLSEQGGFYVPPRKLLLTDVISALRQMGVLPVLAHPLQELTEAELRALLPEAIAAGLAGMETVHSTYTAEMIRRSEAIAAEYRLVPSGGSDFHGATKPDISLGIGKGDLCIPERVYLRLLEARNALRAQQSGTK